MISIITTNVFPGQPHVNRIIKNLGVQTTKDFEWVFVDAFHDSNKLLVAELTAIHGIKHVVHVPFCGATHAGRKFHWEGYNNAILLATRPVFLRLGMWRYFHHEVVEFVTSMAAKNLWVNLTQRAGDVTDDMSHQQIIERFGMDIKTRSEKDHMESHCGMFSFDRQKMIDMNGNNEALTIHHWEDCDLNSRWVQLGKTRLISLEKAFLRIEHRKDTYPYNQSDLGGPYIGKTVCPPEKKHTCPYYVHNNQKLSITGPAQGYNLKWVDDRGYPWAHCPDCGLVAVSHDEQWFELLKTNRAFLDAPINVAGVGRDIRKLQNDLGKLTAMESKLTLLCSSHTDPRYLS